MSEKRRTLARNVAARQFEILRGYGLHIHPDDVNVAAEAIETLIIELERMTETKMQAHLDNWSHTARHCCLPEGGVV